MRPDELTETSADGVRITLPEGIPGPTDGLSGSTLTLLIGPAMPLPGAARRSSTRSRRAGDGQRRAAQRLPAHLRRRQGSPLLTRVLLPAGYFDPGVRVILVVTFDGVPHVLIGRRRSRARSRRPATRPAQSTLTVTGEDLSVLDGPGRAPDPVRRPMPDDRAASTLILAKYALLGIVPLAIPPFFIDVPLPTERIRTQTAPTSQYCRAWPRAPATSSTSSPARRPGMNIAYWGPEIRVGVPQPALSVNMDARHQRRVAERSAYDGLSKTLPIALRSRSRRRSSRSRSPCPTSTRSARRSALRPAIPLKVELLDGDGRA